MIEINHNPAQRELRQFAGIWFPLVCGMVGATVYFKGHHHAAGLAIWCAGAAISLMGLGAPQLIKPVYLALMYATFPIGWVTTHLLMGFLYYVVITPIGLVMRAAGRDPLQRRFNPNATSYWIPREPVTDRKRYFKQY